MAETPLFTGRAVFWLVAAGALSLGAIVLVGLFGPDARTELTNANNTYSDSAVGHRAFLELLRALDVPVVVSRIRTAEKARRNGIVVAAEPIPSGPLAEQLNAVLGADAVFVVLPKRRGLTDPANPRWIARAVTMAQTHVEYVLKRVAPGASIVRPSGPIRWNGDIQPSLTDPQLIAHGSVRPIIASDRGVLLGLRDSGTTKRWVLSDPDILSNDGIGRGDNAVLVARIVERIRTEGQTLFIDETIHGFWQEPSLGRILFSFPMILVTLQAAITIGALAWCAAVRFGMPLPLAPAREPGLTALISTSAGLLQYGGHGREIWSRYVQAVRRSVAVRLNAPRRLTGRDLDAWLERVGKAQGVETPSELLAGSAAHGAPAPARPVEAARTLYVWKQEMLYGARRRSRNLHKP